MARIRTIKPEFWTDEVVAECSTSARLLFIATWNFADDNGNIERSAKQLKAKAFPYDNIDVERFLVELLNAGLLIEYQQDDKIFLHIRGFEKHQKIDRKSTPRCPLYEDSSSVRRVLATEGKGKEGKVGESKVRDIAPKRATQLASDFQPTDDHQALACELGVNLSIELPKFQDYHRAKGSTMKDWNAALRTWIRNARAFAKPEKLNAINKDFSKVDWHKGVNEDGSF